MKVLIDECLPAGLKEMLTTMGHECETVRRAGYGSKKNGELLSLAEGRWDVCSPATAGSSTNRTWPGGRYPSSSSVQNPIAWGICCPSCRPAPKPCSPFRRVKSLRSASCNQMIEETISARVSYLPRQILRSDCWSFHAAKTQFDGTGASIRLFTCHDRYHSLLLIAIRLPKSAIR